MERVQGRNFYHPYLNVEFVVDRQCGMLQCFNDRCVGIRKLGVFANKRNGTCFKETVIPKHNENRRFISSFTGNGGKNHILFSCSSNINSWALESLSNYRDDDFGRDDLL